VASHRSESARVSTRRPPLQRASTTQRATASATIYARLREEVVSLARQPGAAILEKEIAAAYGVSRTPVREAILRLADEGLIEIFPQSGTFVSRIPAAALPEAIIVRKALEETTARLAAERAGAAEIAALEAILKRQREVGANGDQQAFHHADEAFHAAIAAAAGHPRIWTLVQQVKVQVDRVRQLTLPQKGRVSLVIREHMAIAAAIRAHDPAAAAARMGAHLERLIGDIADIRHLSPDFFADAPPAARPAA
jgi:GntR family transcriptional regulator, rspAB operon transcriptional repressor